MKEKIGAQPAYAIFSEKEKIRMGRPSRDKRFLHRDEIQFTRPKSRPKRRNYHRDDVTIEFKNFFAQNSQNGKLNFFLKNTIKMHHPYYYLKFKFGHINRSLKSVNTYSLDQNVIMLDFSALQRRVKIFHEF